MRKLMAFGLLALPLGLGCTSVGGVCDCAPIPGDSTGGFNPHVTYHATCPQVVAPPPVVVTTQASSSDSFEPIGPPKGDK